MKTRKILYSNTYKGNEPCGKWIYPWFDNSDKELDYIFNVKYGTSYCADSSSGIDVYSLRKSAEKIADRKIIGYESIFEFTAKNYVFFRDITDNSSIGKVNVSFNLPEKEQAEDIVVVKGAKVVWQNIIRIPAIQTWERRPAFFTTIGLPYSIEATLSGEGNGNVRHASFEDGLLFIETVTNWETNRVIGFTIEADKSQPLPVHLQMIDSPYFEVVNGGYRLEPLTDGRVLLHLSSQHEVTTTVNWYAGLWTRLIMKDIQTNILQIVKTRSEFLAERFVP